MRDSFVPAPATTLGVRVCREDRLELDRHTETIRTEIGDAKVKVATLPGGGEKMSPEYESCKALAEASGQPIVDVFETVQRAWRVASKSACRPAERRARSNRKR